MGWLVGLHLASLSSVSSPWLWPSHGPQKQWCRPKAVPSIRHALVDLLELVLHLCFIFACMCMFMHLPKRRRHRSGQVYRTRPLVNSHLCVALFAMHVPCIEVQSSRQFSLGSECVQEINFNSRCKVSVYR